RADTGASGQGREADRSAGPGGVDGAPLCRGQDTEPRLLRHGEGADAFPRGAHDVVVVAVALGATPAGVDGRVALPARGVAQAEVVSQLVRDERRKGVLDVEPAAAAQAGADLGQSGVATGDGGG